MRQKFPEFNLKGRKFLRRRIFSFILVLTLSASPNYSEITIASAANMQFAIKEIITVYHNKTGFNPKPVFGSSGKLTAQIQAGAPFDLFVSADMHFCDSLYKKGLATTQPKLYASGALVLWTLKDNVLSQGIESLTSPTVKSIAIGDLKLTIYGPAAKEALEKKGIWKQVEHKLVYGENINTVAQYIVNKSVDAGITNKSFTQSGPMAGKGHWIEIDTSLHSNLPQGAVILKYGQTKNPKGSKMFYDFLFGIESKKILKKHGYILPD